MPPGFTFFLQFLITFMDTYRGEFSGYTRKGLYILILMSGDPIKDRYLYGVVSDLQSHV